MNLALFEARTAVRAYYLWEAAGRPLWQHEHHWSRAQAELAAERLAEIDEAIPARALPRAPARAVTPLRKKRARLAIAESPAA